MKTYLHYPMKTLVNCRDLGGMPTADGGVTRFGVFIRSELPVDLAQEDIEMFKEFNVTTSVDLRTDPEVVNSPSDLKFCDFIDYKHVAIKSKQAEMGSEVKGKKIGPPSSLDDLAGIEWPAVYIKMLKNRPEWVYEIFEVSVNAKGAVHYNCATGKDRTGIFSAFMLAAVGVGEDDICANYSLSEVYMRPYYIGMVDKMTNGNFTEEDLNRGFFSTSQNTMRAVLKYLKEEYGGTMEYFKYCGVTDEMIQKLKNKFVDY